MSQEGPQRVINTRSRRASVAAPATKTFIALAALFFVLTGFGRPDTQLFQALARTLAPLRIDPQQHVILVVEDDAEARAVISRALSREGWQVLEAAHGREGLERLAGQRPDLILLDLMMPEMDGFQFVDALRENESWRDVPLVVITARDITAADATRLEGSVQRILQKGQYTHDELRAEVRRHVRLALQRRRGRDDA